MTEIAINEAPHPSAWDEPAGELLARIGRGDPAAWGEVIRQYGRLVLRAAARTGWPWRPGGMCCTPTHLMRPCWSP